MSLFKIVKKVIDEWDSYNLLGEMNCPDDEYDSESREIADNFDKK